MVRGDKRDTQATIRTRLQLWSRTLEIDRHIQVFAESRAAALLGGFHVDQVQMSVEVQGPSCRSRVRVEAGGHAVVAVSQARSIRQAIIGALGRASRALSRSIERSRTHRRRWQQAIGLSLLLFGTSVVQGCATGASNARFNGPPTNDTRQLVLQVHASGGEPDASRLQSGSDAALVAPLLPVVTHAVANPATLREAKPRIDPPR